MEGEAEIVMAKATCKDDDLIVPRKVKEAPYESLTLFCMKIQETHHQFSSRNPHLALNPNIHAIIAIPARVCEDANTQTTHNEVFVEDDECFRRQEDPMGLQKSEKSQRKTKIV